MIRLNCAEPAPHPDGLQTPQCSMSPRSAATVPRRHAGVWSAAMAGALLSVLATCADGWADEPTKNDQRAAAKKDAAGGADAARNKSPLPHAGLTPQQAADAMDVPEGFSVQLFAGEPDVVQPIAMALDDRGRLWVAEAYSYPHRQPDDKAKDRILIFADSNGDGQFDERTVFIEGLNLVSGLEVGFGGVWVGAAPYLLFISDSDRDDKPDGDPEVLLDGWGFQDTHETLNSFIWGPDGWLYGCHGVFTHSRPARPGTPIAKRVRLNAGVWRYHPTKHQFEVFAHGTSNPWGIDFDDHGQAMITACVIPHLYHIFPGGRYRRQAGAHFNKHTYNDIKTIADHAHYVGNIRDHAHWGHTPVVPTETAEVGGGHAHAGAMIYLGGSWPDEYRGKLLMNNIHGGRINMDILEPNGSGFVGRHGPDLVKSNDLWSQIINLRYGPDGQVYMIDWYDKNQCHRRDPDTHDRSNGRIFKVVYGTPEPVTVDLQEKTDVELVALQLHENDWYVRHARRILQERAAAERLSDAATAELVTMATKHEDPTRQLRALWVLHATNHLDEAIVERALAASSDSVRAWAVRLAVQQGPLADKALDRFAAMARDDSSPVVRLALAAALQEIPIEHRWPILEGLSSHAEDASDHNLPLMVWYAAEPLVPGAVERSLELATASQIPLLLSHTARRVASIGTAESLHLLVETLGRAPDAEQQRTILAAMRTALEGRRKLEMPQGWPAVYARLVQSTDVNVKRTAMALAVTFGDPQAVEMMRQRLTDRSASVAERSGALKVLVESGQPRLAETLHTLIDDPVMRRPALRALARFDDPKTPQVILGAYASFSQDEKRDALGTLASRTAFAKGLLAAIGRKQLPASDLTADLIRQLRNLEDAGIDKQIASVWGIVRDPSRDKAAEMQKYKSTVFDDDWRERADLSLGRSLFAKTCRQCHTLFGDGSNVGPDITGSNRSDLDYLLSNVLDPSAVLAKEYMPTVLATEGGRVITGLILEEDESVLRIQTANETMTLPLAEIAARKRGDKSMMPDDLLRTLSHDQVRALFAYLGSPEQVPMLATKENVGDFFNGQDLVGWQGNPSLWSVEEGVIVGRSPGLKRNEFLRSQLVVGDFHLKMQVQLSPNTGNSGIQFRSETLPRGLVKGYQADMGAGWWGKLYEEHGRKLLSARSGASHVRPNEWNTYEIAAEGSRIRTWINGQLCVDLDDPDGARGGIIALQIHSGPAMEVRFKDLQLEVLGE